MLYLICSFSLPLLWSHTGEVFLYGQIIIKECKERSRFCESVRSMEALLFALFLSSICSQRATWSAQLKQLAHRIVQSIIIISWYCDNGTYHVRVWVHFAVSLSRSFGCFSLKVNCITLFKVTLCSNFNYLINICASVIIVYFTEQNLTWISQFKIAIRGQLKDRRGNQEGELLPLWRNKIRTT